MIKTLTAVAVVLAASLSVAQAADPNANELFVAQIGNSNAATVGQVGGNNTQATFQVPLFHFRRLAPIMAMSQSPRRPGSLRRDFRLVLQPGCCECVAYCSIRYR